MAIPDGWNKFRLGDAAEFVNGRAFKPSDWSTSGVPIIRIQNLNGGGIFNYFQGECEPRYLVSSGDLLFSWSGTRGTSFGAHLWMGPTAILNQHIFKVEHLQGVEKSFFFHELRHITSDIEKKAHGGTGIVHITKGQLEDFTFLCPPLPEQKKIAAILSSVDEVIAKTESVIAQLQIVKKAMMEQLLTKGMPGRHTRFKQTEIGEIPEEWEVVTVESIAERSRSSLTNGPFGSDLLTTELVSVGVPVIYIRDIRDGIYARRSDVYVTTEKAETLSFCNVRAGDLLIAKVGDPPGVAAVYPAVEHPGIVTQDVIRLRLDRSRAAPPFLWVYLNSNIGISQIDGIAIEGTRKRISLTDFRKLLVSLPPTAEQVEIGQAVNVIESRIASEQAYLRALRLTKSALSSSLLSGEIRVVAGVA